VDAVWTLNNTSKATTGCRLKKFTTEPEQVGEAANLQIKAHAYRLRHSCSIGWRIKAMTRGDSEIIWGHKNIPAYSEVHQTESETDFGWGDGTVRGSAFTVLPSHQIAPGKWNYSTSSFVLASWPQPGLGGGLLHQQSRWRFGWWPETGRFQRAVHGQAWREKRPNSSFR
jgi:hypothetical protein